MSFDAAAVIHDLFIQAGLNVVQQLKALPLVFNRQVVNVEETAVAEYEFERSFKPLRILLDPSFTVVQIWIDGERQLLGCGEFARPWSPSYTEVHWPMKLCLANTILRFEVRNISGAPCTPRYTIMGVEVANVPD